MIILSYVKVMAIEIKRMFPSCWIKSNVLTVHEKESSIYRKTTDQKIFPDFWKKFLFAKFYTL